MHHNLHHTPRSEAIQRLNFGISSAAEVFQNVICQTLQGISGVKNLSDDIIIHGKTQAEHDDTLRVVFQRLKERGLTLNRKKCEFDKSSLEFFGFIFSADRISADPKKVAAIKQASMVENNEGLKGYLCQMFEIIVEINQVHRRGRALSLCYS